MKDGKTPLIHPLDERPSFTKGNAAEGVGGYGFGEKISCFICSVAAASEIVRLLVLEETHSIFFTGVTLEAVTVNFSFSFAAFVCVL